MWEEKGNNKWKLNSDSLEGKAAVKEVDGGYKLKFKVQEKEFGMEIRRRNEFFENKSEAEKEIKEEMKEFKG